MVSLVLPALACLVFAERGDAATPVDQPARFTVVDLGRFMAREAEDKPGLNAAGEVAAWQVVSENSTQAALLKGGQSTNPAGLNQNANKDAEAKLDKPTNTFALGLNNHDAVVGIVESRNDIRDSQAFLWNKATLEILPTLGGRSASAHAINSQGQIAGSAQNAAQRLHAALWEHGKVRDLGTLAGGDISRAFDVNDQGEVAGEANTVPNGKPHAVVWSKGGMRDLGLLPGGTFSSAMAVNLKQQVVGYADNDDGGSRPVLWSHGKVLDLGSFGDDPSTALDINDAGQVVGTSALAEGKMRAFLWEDGKLNNLNDLIPRQSGWLLLTAYRINDKGEILVYGFYRGATHAGLLVPQKAASQARIGSTPR